jgi:hypothetical protein
MTGATISFEGKDYLVENLLGKGKSAFSYLVAHETEKLVLKVIHDEPCPYYEFQDKFKSEIAAYNRLINLGMNMPGLKGVNEKKPWIFKDFIDGDTAAQHIATNQLTDYHFAELFKMAGKAKETGLNLDFFPTNFVLCCDKLYYVDYETNPYHEDWNLENWGLFYWFNHNGMKDFLDTGDASVINADQEKGIPIKEPFVSEVKRIIQKFSKIR